MKNKWKTIRLGLMLLALPLVATAAATAHQLMVDGTPIEVNLQIPTASNSAIGLARVHTVALNQSGAIEGRIGSIEDGTTTGISDLKVFFVQNGEVVSQSTTQQDGSFLARNVPEGAYSFVATGESGFAAYGVHVVSGGNGNSNNLMEAAAVSPQFDSVKQILDEKLPKAVTDQIVATEASTKRIVGSNRVRLRDGQLQGSVVALLGATEAVEGTYVHILQKDKQIAEVQADESGSFMVSDLEPGVYDFVAAGPTGFAAVSFEAVQDEGDSVISDDVADIVDTEEIPVSVEPAAVEPGFVTADPITYQDAMYADIPYDAGYSDSLNVCMTCQQDAGFVNEQVAYAADPAFQQQPATSAIYDAPIEYASEAVGCGGAAGGSCGQAANFGNFSACNSCSPCNNPCGGRKFGGRFAGLLGGAGGGGALLQGGIGRLALLGGLAVGVVSIADDDSDNMTDS